MWSLSIRPTRFCPVADVMWRQALKLRVKYICMICRAEPPNWWADVRTGLGDILLGYLARSALNDGLDPLRFGHLTIA